MSENKLNPLQIQVLDYLINLYPEMRKVVIESYLGQRQEFDINKFIENSAKIAMSNLVPIAIAFDKTHTSFEDTAEIDQSNTHMFILGDKRYKATLKMSLDIEDITPEPDPEPLPEKVTTKK